MEKPKRKPWIYWAVFLSTMIVVFFLGLLASSITERRAEKENVVKPKVKLDNFEPRNELWGENYPRQYNSYMQTADTSFKSKYNGSANVDALEEFPALVVLWAGYAFAKDYNQPKGHYYGVTDVYNTLRTGAPKDENDGPQPSTCWTCKSPDVPRLMNTIGIKEFYSKKWASFGSEIVNPIGCADCHDPETMNLRITRPALIEAYERQGKDIKKASLQEMRSLVCAQCHVEYYFDKSDGISNYLKFPWDKGMAAEQMEEYYDSYQFSDWTHALSKAPMLKAQHPDYEMFTTGVHYSRGIACADCHMPYKTEGGQKFTNHKIQSPLNNVENSCHICHREETEKLIADVYSRQDKIISNRNLLEELLVRAHVEAKTAWDKGATEPQMKEILQYIRKAQWRWDFAAAGHGNSFHAPLETSRIIASGIAKAQEARVLLARLLTQLGVKEAIPYPDIATKAQAQQFIGLNMKQFREEKQQFKNTMLPKWLETAKERQSKMAKVLI